MPKKRMTADEWHRCPRSDWMLLPLHEWSLANPATAAWLDRKLRLYTVACCRQHWDLFETDLFQRAVDAAERLANGRADQDQLASLYDAIMALPTPNAQSHCIEELTLRLIRESGIKCALAAALALGSITGWDNFQAVAEAQAPLLRCVVGNPFRPLVFDPRWRTPAVVEIAEAIDTDRTFDRMPILADALEDAACNYAEVLSHCRNDGPHVHGCWVIDELLGKSILHH